MRKLIAVLSLVSVLGFAVALANTNDSSSSNPGTSDVSGSGSMSGGSGSMSGGSGSMSGGAAGVSDAADTAASDASKSAESAQTTVKKQTDKWTSAKSCTDENGMTYYKGKSGFQSCVDKMRKSEHHDQMGGTTPSDMEKSEKTVESTTHTDTSSIPSDSSSSSTSN